MKKQSFISSFVLLITATFIVASTNLVFAADVASLVNKGITKNELGEDISVAEINCTSASPDPRVITSKVGERDWCSADVPDMCSRTKLGAAKKVCHFSFSNQREEYQSRLATPNQVVSPAPEPVASESAAPSAEEQAASDKVQLEKERISIEQQKLQIRRQELELNKRQLELERQAVTTE